VAELPALLPSIVSNKTRYLTTAIPHMKQSSVLEPPVAAVLTAECVNYQCLRDIRRINPPLQEVAKPKCGITDLTISFFINP
jgi:hypothetical protein